MSSLLSQGFQTNPPHRNVGTIAEQTGWQRPHPNMLCNSFDAKARVTDYDFNLLDPDFQDYCQRRGLLYTAGRNKRFQFTANHNATKAEFFELFRYAEPQRDGSRYRFSDSEMESHWRIMLATKGGFQDGWELFVNERDACTKHQTSPQMPSTPSELPLFDFVSP